MKIKCIRCGKDLGHADENNAKYIMNPNDSRTFGMKTVEKVIKAPLSRKRVDEICRIGLGERIYEEIEGKRILKEIIPLPMSEFVKLTEIYLDKWGRREVVIEEEIEVPKTAIVCLDCYDEKNDVKIW